MQPAANPPAVRVGENARPDRGRIPEKNFAAGEVCHDAERNDEMKGRKHPLHDIGNFPEFVGQKTEYKDNCQPFDNQIGAFVEQANEFEYTPAKKGTSVRSAFHGWTGR